MPDIELEPANPRDRLAATGVDLLLVLLAGSLTLTFTDGVDPTLRLGLLLLAVGAPTYLPEGVLGRSPGKVGTGLRHADPATLAPGERPLSTAQTIGRFVLKWLVPSALVVVGLWLPAVVWWVGLYAPALGPSRRAAHDRLTRTRVLGPADRGGGRMTDY